MQDDDQKASKAELANGMTPALPAEVLSRIISCLVSPVDRNASTLPHPAGTDLDWTPALPSSTSVDLLSAASSSTLLHHIASQALYRAPLLRTLKSLNLLAGTITSDTKKQPSSTADEFSRATWIRSIHLPPGDGLLQPGDTLADQACYVESLRALFDHASRLDFVSLEHRQAGAALLEFLHPSTICRPRRVTLSNLSFSAPPFSTSRSLAPLSQLTHLHLIKIVPPPALISFLVGESINSDDQGNVPKSIKDGLSPSETLECLRLSLLPPDALVEFEAYIGWRKAWKEYEQLSSQQQAQEPAPRAPRGPARRFAVQEALYDLAVYSSRLPRLRLLLLELSPLGPLPSPVEEERQNDRFAAYPRNRVASSLPVSGYRTPVSSRETSASTNGRKLQSAEVRAQRSDAYYFLDAIKTSRTAAERATLTVTADPSVDSIRIFADRDGHRNDERDLVDRTDEANEALPVTAEELRTAERDKYWRLIEAGKVALIELWRASQQPTNGVAASDLPEIRVVTARPMGHDRREGFQDFYCQAQHEPYTTTFAPMVRSSESATNGSIRSGCETAEEEEEEEEEVGCWADPDVFSLVPTAPYLSFKTRGGHQEGWYWTGELPRESHLPSISVIPSLIACS
ncbi:uncharacterized protein UTRI_02685_B [Ustilago trichophora]|uniref:Uncharacterized protein n=1 Tax=Ustilago trichophora TaxID=86804 RepID=A0A5C3E3B6_9BASI|nr:uncharacterized protein UTRI_02685_B [Ustilago trichophora]